MRFIYLDKGFAVKALTAPASAPTGFGRQLTLVLLLSIAAVIPRTSPGQSHVIPFTDANWIPWQGVNGTVSAIAINPNNGLMYIGGQFTNIGPVAATNVAVWNGNNWSPVGTGFQRGTVTSMAFDTRGLLYAAGPFWNYSGPYLNSIAKWDGTNWTTMGSGIGGYDTAYAVATDKSGNVFVGGKITAAGGVPAQNVARWDGTNWFALGSGCEGNVGVDGLCVTPAGDLFAGGTFGYAGNVYANNVGRWDGKNWFALGSGVTPIPGNLGVTTMTLDGAGNLYVGGIFTNVGSLAANHVARWDGTNWSALGAGVGSSYYAGTNLNAMAFDGNGLLYVGGGFYFGAGGIGPTNIARWDGTNWSNLGSGIRGTVNALCYDGNGHLFVGGNFSTAGGKTSPNFAEAIVGTATNPAPVSITNNGGVLGLSWPLDHFGWRLQSQTNLPPNTGIGTNWFTIPGSTNVNATNFPINPGVGSVFYRLVYP